LDKAVKPVPILQLINLIFGIFTLLFEWPIRPIAGSSIHQSIEFRLLFFPLLALAAFVMYQSTNAGLYYVIAEVIYFWAFYDGEVGTIQEIVGEHRDADFVIGRVSETMDTAKTAIHQPGSMKRIFFFFNFMSIFFFFSTTHHCIARRHLNS
jgi:hypothetical protein